MFIRDVFLYMRMYFDCTENISVRSVVQNQIFIFKKKYFCFRVRINFRVRVIISKNVMQNHFILYLLYISIIQYLDIKKCVVLSKAVLVIETISYT